MILDGLETTRLRFRKLTLGEVTSWVEFCSDEVAIKYLWFTVDEAKTASEAWIKKQLLRYEEVDCGLCAVELKETGEFIGQCGILLQDVDGNKEWEVGYHFKPAFWNKGFATEAARASRDAAFSHGLSDHIISIVHVDNERSAQVALRNGMDLWKTTTFSTFPVNIFRITRKAWLATN
jgi:[ribosomal protein S5]-alanine N-acetyltransferase